MKKYLLIFSLVIISLLSVGAVCAAEGDNVTDDSIMPMASVDVNDELEIDDMDNLEATSEVDELETVDEEPAVLNQANNQSTEILSDDAANSNKPKVTVGKITFESFDSMNVPFTVVDSEGLPVSGGVVVTVFGENNNLAKYVELKDGSGQVNFKISELFNVLDVGDKDIDIYGIVTSSINPDMSEIINGFDEITDCFSINFTNIVNGWNQITEGNYVNVSEFKEGVGFIENSFTVNISSIKDGIKEIIDAFNINISDIVQNIINDPNVTKVSDDLNGIMGEFTSMLSVLLNDVSQGISFNKTVIDDVLDSIYKEFDFNSSFAINKIDDMMNYLNFNSELQNKITEILEGNNLNLTYIVQVINEVIDTNLTLSNFTDAFANVTNLSDFNVSDFINKLMDFNFTNAASKIAGSLIFDYGVIIDSIIDSLDNNTFDFSKVSDYLVDIIGISVGNISNIVDGIGDIINGISFNLSCVTSGLKDILSAFSLNFTNVTGILDGFDLPYMASCLLHSLNQIGITPFTMLIKFGEFASYLNMTFTDEFISVFEGIFNGEPFNFTKFMHALKGVYDYNNLTVLKIFDALYNVTNGFDVSGIIQKITDPDFNSSMISDDFHEIFQCVFSGISNALTVLFNNLVNMSRVSDGLDSILDVISFNSSAIEEGFNKISHEINFNGSSVIGAIIENIKNGFNINTSSIIDGLSKIIDAFYLNVSSIEEGSSKMIDSFKFNITGLLCGVSKIINSFSFNASKIVSGFKNVVKGIGVNISNIVNQIFSKLVDGAVFSFLIIPEEYIISFKVPTKISASKVSTTYGKSKKMVITLKDITSKALKGKKVTVKLNGKKYTGVTNAKGQVTIKVPKNLVPKTYKASITFAGDSKYSKTTSTVKVVVSKLTPKLTAKKITFKSSVKTKKYTVTLKTNKNKVMKKKQITLKVNGKTYKVKTNAKGKATFKITNLLKKGTFKTVVKFNGDKYYKKVSKTINILVK